MNQDGYLRDFNGCPELYLSNKRRSVILKWHLVEYHINKIKQLFANELCLLYLICCRRRRR